MRAVKNHDAVSNATRLERRQDVPDRIAFLVRQEEEVLAEKRKRIEGMLWAIHEANIGDLWETYEAALSPDLCKVIEDVDVDAKGNAIPRLYSKLQANRELRQMFNMGGQKERDIDDVSKLSDAELIQQLADQAKELGIEIDLNYSFAQPPKPEE